MNNQIDAGHFSWLKGMVRKADPHSRYVEIIAPPNVKVNLGQMMKAIFPGRKEYLEGGGCKLSGIVKDEATYKIIESFLEGATKTLPDGK